MVYLRGSLGGTRVQWAPTKGDELGSRGPELGTHRKIKHPWNSTLTHRADNSRETPPQKYIPAANHTLGISTYLGGYIDPLVVPRYICSYIASLGGPGMKK